jgi:predicted GIY-YIG superfamily endonuclease
MAYRVYVLQNPKVGFCIGISDNAVRRIDQHDAGESKGTKGKGPWQLAWQSDPMNLSEARKLELLLKR